MIQYSRIPAILVLLLVLAPGTYYLYARQSDAAALGASRLAELQLAIARPDAKPSDWQAYALTLQNLQRYKESAWAYERLLELEPANRLARLNRGVCLADTGVAPELAVFMKDTIHVDPKLAVEILARPELKSYMSSPNFQDLKREADAGAMD